LTQTGWKEATPFQQFACLGYSASPTRGKAEYDRTTRRFDIVAISRFERRNLAWKAVMSNVKLFVILAAASLLVIFTIQNAAEIEVNLFFWSITTRRAFLVFGVLVIGILIGWIFHSISAHRKDQVAPRSGSTEPGAVEPMRDDRRV